MRHAQLLSDLAQVARGRLAILHHARAADHFQVGDPGEVGENFILHAIGKISVVLVRTQVLKGQDRDRFLWDGDR